MKSDKSYQEMMTKTEVISLGYTEKLIRELLPEPTKKRTGYGSYCLGSYCLLFPKEAVMAGLEDPRVIKAKESRAKRSEAALEVAQKNGNRLLPRSGS